MYQHDTRGHVCVLPSLRPRRSIAMIADAFRITRPHPRDELFSYIHMHVIMYFFTYSNGYLIMLNINAVTVIVGFRVCKEVTSKAQWFCSTCILVKQLFYCFFLELKHSLASEL